MAAAAPGYIRTMQLQHVRDYNLTGKKNAVLKLLGSFAEIFKRVIFQRMKVFVDYISLWRHIILCSGFGRPTSAAVLCYDCSTFIDYFSGTSSHCDQPNHNTPLGFCNGYCTVIIVISHVYYHIYVLLHLMRMYWTTPEFIMKCTIFPKGITFCK